MLHQSPYNKLTENPKKVALIPINLTANVLANIVKLSDSITWYYIVLSIFRETIRPFEKLLSEIYCKFAQNLG